MLSLDLDDAILDRSTAATDSFELFCERFNILLGEVQVLDQRDSFAAASF